MIQILVTKPMFGLPLYLHLLQLYHYLLFYFILKMGGKNKNKGANKFSRLLLIKFYIFFQVIDFFEKCTKKTMKTEIYCSEIHTFISLDAVKDSYIIIDIEIHIIYFFSNITFILFLEQHLLFL